MQWYIGTMGFSYKDWSGSFYPVEISSREFLSYYSQIFNVVEVDSTFYGTPRPEYVQRWAEQTPEGFQFCVKVPRAVTHDLGLLNADYLLEEFLETMRLLGDKLGVILFQFPPSYHEPERENLEKLLPGLPRDLRFAVEFRHPSWYAAEAKIADLLSRYEVCWAATQYPGLPQDLHRTAPFLYLRWIGRHGAFSQHDHERIDRTKDLQRWWEKIQADQAGLRAFYGFMNNDYAGFAPATANRFKRIAGLPVEPLTRPQQGRLF